jgi:phosphohistidine phosphatase
VSFEEELYAADADRLLERLRLVPADVESVLLVGHNPGLQDLALDLASAGDQLDELRRKLPTGALATLAFEGSWHELGPGQARLEDLVVPRALL